MPRSLRIIVVVIALVAIFVTFKFYFSQGAGPAGAGNAAGPAFLVGAPAQSYPVVDLHGNADSLGHYRGSVVLVNLWASWCAPCRSETPALERLYEDERARGLVVLGIDQGESRSAAAQFASEMHLQYPILLDEDQAYGRAYAAIGLPTSIVVDRAGHIVQGIDGERTLAQMHDAVDPVLGAKPGKAL